MTSLVAAAMYEREHLARYQGRPVAVFNPNNLTVESLPTIYGFNNGGAKNRLNAELLAEDGTHLGGHGCSSEAYMPADLGVLEGSSDDRHKVFKKHYPNGYKMSFVGEDRIFSHAGLLAAIELNKTKGQK